MIKNNQVGFLFHMHQINNAGVLVSEKVRQLTADGLEVTFATNTLGKSVFFPVFRIPSAYIYFDPVFKICLK